MLNGLRDLFLEALRCDDEATARRLVAEWNMEIKRIQKIFDRMTFYREAAE